MRPRSKYIAYVAAFIALGLLIGAAVGAWQWMMGAW
jgi:hypothetical protein